MYIFFQIHILTRVLIIWKIETQKKNLFYFIKSKYRVINSIQCRIYIFILFLEFDYIDYDFVSSPLPLKRYLDRSIDCSVSLLTVTHRYIHLLHCYAPLLHYFSSFFIVSYRFVQLFFYLNFLATRIQKNVKKLFKPIE